MAGITKAHIQLGDSATATNNFMLTAQAADGTMKLARGNNGATTQDVLTVSASGVVKLPSNLVAFSAYQSVVQSVTLNVTTKVIFQTKDFDTTNAFDSTTNYRFTPQVAGYYQINAGVGFTGVDNIISIYIYKNGASWRQGGYIAASTTGPIVTMSSLVFLNGTTDYIEIFTITGTTLNTTATQLATWVNGYLVGAS